MAAVLFYILANKLKSIKEYTFFSPFNTRLYRHIIEITRQKYNLEISFGYLFQIKPYYNLYNAALLNFLDIDCPFIIVLIIRLSILFIFPLILKMYDELKADYFYIQIAFILLISGGLCSILDMIIFWLHIRLYIPSILLHNGFKRHLRRFGYSHNNCLHN